MGGEEVGRFVKEMFDSSSQDAWETVFLPLLNYVSMAPGRSWWEDKHYWRWFGSCWSWRAQVDGKKFPPHVFVRPPPRSSVPPKAPMITFAPMGQSAILGAANMHWLKACARTDGVVLIHVFKRLLMEQSGICVCVRSIITVAIIKFSLFRQPFDLAWIQGCAHRCITSWARMYELAKVNRPSVWVSIV